MAVVIYFSHGGETLINGEIKKLDIGNTAKLAQLIGKQLGMPTFPILAAIPYPDSYDQTLQRSKLDADKLVAIQPIAVDLKAERDIYIGFPVWWGTLPGAVATFLQQATLSGKVIHPFCTHEGSGFGNCLEVIHELVPDATIAKGLLMRGSRVECASQAVSNWLN